MLLGDSGYPLRRYLLTPFADVETAAQEKYNKALCHTRVKIECCFGILRNRFQCLMKPLRVIGPEASGNVILSCMVLHNLAIRERDLFEPLPQGNYPWLADGPLGDNNNEEGKRIRNHFVNSFFS